MRPWERAPSEQLLRGIGEFNRGDWFDCHETLEELWVGEKGELRDFYQGLRQLAVALHHWRNGNFKGALTLLRGGCVLLGRVPAVCQGVDVAGLRADAAILLATLSALGEDRIAELTAPLILRVRLVQPGSAG